MLNNDGICVALLSYLSKAFDCLPHDPILAKLHAYGLDSKISKIIKTVRIVIVYRSWHYILSGVPQESILRSNFI